MKDVQNVRAVLERMAELLFMGGYDNLANVLLALRAEAPDDPLEVATKIFRLYGGMGSLNDVVLCANGRALNEENTEFYDLSERLYELCHDYKDE